MQAHTALTSPLIDNNPVTLQVLGICSALAITNSLSSALIMIMAVTSVLAFSNVTISAIRRHLPNSVRLIVQVTVIASGVIVVDEFLQAFAPDASRTLSVFVGLIVTNCIVLGRTEGYALANPPIPSFLDGLANGIGYSSILIGVAFVRELLGSGKLLGFNVIPAAFYQAGYENMGLMLLAPGAFIVIGLFVWLQHTLLKK